MSIAMRIPAVSHAPVEREQLAEKGERKRRRSRWHRLGWTGFEALGFLILLVVIALVGPQLLRWGEMINEAARYFEDYPWQMIAPGLCIAATVLSINLLGDGLRDVADPRTR